MIKVINVAALWETLAQRVHSEIQSRAQPFDVFYEYGRYNEVSNTLTQKGQSISEKKRYPLIWLVYPFKVVESIAEPGCELKGLEIVIATQTEQNSTTKDRIAANFVPYLYPIYEELCNQIDRSGFFTDIDFDNHFTRIDQVFWDGKNNKGYNLFGDHIDAIQVFIDRLKVNEQTCDRFQLLSGTAA